MGGGLEVTRRGCKLGCQVGLQAVRTRRLLLTAASNQLPKELQKARRCQQSVIEVSATSPSVRYVSTAKKIRDCG